MLRSRVLFLLLLCCAATAAQRLTKDQTPLCKTNDGLKALAQQLKVEGAPDKVATAAQLYLWGVPLLAMAQSLETTGIQTKAINSLNSINQVLTPQSQFIYNIVASNSDTLYTVGWLDLSDGPVVLSAGASNGRFYTLELLDFYTEVIGNPGVPQTGDQASKFVVMPCGTDKNKLPATLQSGVTKYFCSNTTIVWVLGRTFVEGQKDLPAAQAVQASLKAIPPTTQGKAKAVEETTAAKTANAAAALIKEGGWANGVTSASKPVPVFSAILGLAKAWPPTDATSGPLKAAPELGLDPSKGFNQPSLNSQQQQVLASGARVGQTCIQAYTDLTVGGKALKYGWGYLNVVGNYGTNYLSRAVVATAGLGANWLNVTIYPSTVVDQDGVPLTGANGNTYTWTVDDKSLPPSKWFTSFIIYNGTNKMIPVVPNAPRWRVNYPANKGDFAKNSDGSVTFWLSYAPPGPPDSPKYKNWIPLSDGPSLAMVRMYGPSPQAVAGNFQLPPIVKVK